MKEEVKKIRFRHQFSGEVANDQERFDNSNPKVVCGQALTCSELFRRISNGLPVGCAVRQFNQVNPYLEKMSIYDGIAQYRIKHGMVDKITVENLDKGDVNKSPQDKDTTPPNEEGKD